MKAQTFHPMDSIVKRRLSHAFEMVCDKNGIYQGTDMQSFSYSMKKSAGAALTACSSLKSKSLHYTLKEGVLSDHCKVLNHFREKYATDDIIAKADGKIARFARTLTICHHC